MGTVHTGVAAGARYKYELVTANGRLILKTDPMAFALGRPPERPASWRPHRPTSGGTRLAGGPAQTDLSRVPLAAYEVHLGSWRHRPHEDGGTRPLTYLELAEELPPYVAEMGFTHVEMMPVAEHPFAGSWGYQISGYYRRRRALGLPTKPGPSSTPCISGASG